MKGNYILYNINKISTIMFLYSYVVPNLYDDLIRYHNKSKEKNIKIRLYKIKFNKT